MEFVNENEEDEKNQTKMSIMTQESERKIEIGVAIQAFVGTKE